MTPDSNVLVAVSRSDQPHHAVARNGLEEGIAALASGRTFVLLPMVLASLRRWVNSPGILREPTPTTAVMALVDALLAADGVRLAPRGPEWPR
ncbi:MAG: hypothetical protein IT494_04185 [Gammaproteobacteria bacterium]|nr:hypothetical protein [Gammaproteobacteria bacterium]